MGYLKKAKPRMNYTLLTDPRRICKCLHWWKNQTRMHLRSREHRLVERHSRLKVCFQSPWLHQLFGTVVVEQQNEWKHGIAGFFHVYAKCKKTRQ
jgi:hypothetical protein